MKGERVVKFREVKMFYFAVAFASSLAKYHYPNS
jgi:hypothetical protein